MDLDVLRALADPVRLQIVELLRERPRSVNEVAAALGLRQPQTSKHLRTLAEAGLTTVYPVAQQRFHGLAPEPLRQLHEWTGSFRTIWDIPSAVHERHLRSIERHGAVPPGTAAPFTAQRLVAASPAAVWAAWTEPDLLAAWYAPDYFTVPQCRVDARPGGEIRLDLQGPDGSLFPMTGRFRELAEPSRLSYVATPLDAGGAALFELLVTATFTGRDGGTDVAVAIDTLSTTPEGAVHLAGLEPGWRQNLDKLARLLEAGDDPEGTPS